ncbi:MAG: SURF1 family protein [Chloroflexi bacterium]|nr:SURF1 family protein [Chloroflexota bacterium]
MRMPRSSVVLLALAAAGAVVLSGLGTWQLMRNDYKHDLARELDARVAAAPLAPAEAFAMPDEDLDYRRLAFDGEWDYERVQVIANRTRYGQRGEEVVVPLRPAGGGPAVLVNRGWYPVAEREAVLAILADEDQGLDGLIRVGRSLRATQGSDGLWTRFDVASIAELLPYDVVTWRATAGELVEHLPRSAPRERPVTLYEGYRNTTPHMEYALTWFGLAVAMLVTAGVRVWRGGAESRPEEPPDSGTED